MRLILNIEGGPSAGQQVVVTAGRPFYVGRTETAYLAVPDDARMAPAHFVLECTKQIWYVRDLGTQAGTLVNGERVTKAELRDGSMITAGKSKFVVRMEQEGSSPSGPVSPVSSPVTMVSPPPPVPGPLSIEKRVGAPRTVLEVLNEQPEPLYAILDAARDPLIYALVLECKEEHQSLYDGPKGDQLALVAPYLVRLPSGSPFLQMMIEKGWGKSWGVYLTSRASFAEVRKHLRRFLVVQLEGLNKVYFRFYDPRVLRLYLPTCNEEELGEFIGPIDRFLVEEKDPLQLEHFKREGRLLARNQVALRG